MNSVFLQNAHSSEHARSLIINSVTRDFGDDLWCVSFLDILFNHLNRSKRDGHIWETVEEQTDPRSVPLQPRVGYLGVLQLIPQLSRTTLSHLGNALLASNTFANTKVQRELLFHTDMTCRILKHIWSLDTRRHRTIKPGSVGTQISQHASICHGFHIPDFC